MMFFSIIKCEICDRDLCFCENSVMKMICGDCWISTNIRRTNRCKKSKKRLKKKSPKLAYLTK